jgi:hypothetical protein
MPQCKAAQEISLSAYDLENIGELTRENVENWLGSHSGDFSQVIDFRADLSLEDGTDWVSEWAHPDSEYDFCDAMYPSPEDE